MYYDKSSTYYTLFLKQLNVFKVAYFFFVSFDFVEQEKTFHFEKKNVAEVLKLHKCLKLQKLKQDAWVEKVGGV